MDKWDRRWTALGIVTVSFALRVIPWFGGAVIVLWVRSAFATGFFGGVLLAASVVAIVAGVLALLRWLVTWGRLSAAMWTGRQDWLPWDLQFSNDEQDQEE